MFKQCIRLMQRTLIPATTSLTAGKPALPLLRYVVNPSIYREARDILAQAREELEVDHRQAGQKGWLAADKAMKQLAESFARPDLIEVKKLFSHANKRFFATHLSRRFGSNIHDHFNSAHSLHINFYTGEDDEKGVEYTLDKVEQFIDELEALHTRCSLDEMSAIFAQMKLPKEEEVRSEDNDK